MPAAIMGLINKLPFLVDRPGISQTIILKIGGGGGGHFLLFPASHGGRFVAFGTLLKLIPTYAPGWGRSGFTLTGALVIFSLENFKQGHKLKLTYLYKGGSVVEWFRALEVPGSNPPFQYYLDLFSVVPSSTSRPCCVNSQLVGQLGFLTVYVIFKIFGY